MSLWLPYPNFAVSALVMSDETVEWCLETARNIQSDIQDGHHLVQDWRPWGPHVLAVMMYSDCMVREWLRRGHTTEWAVLMQSSRGDVLSPPGYSVPEFVGQESYHRAQREAMVEHGMLKEMVL